VRALAEEVTAGADVFLNKDLRHNADAEEEKSKHRRALFCSSALHLLARMRAEESSTDGAVAE